MLGGFGENVQLDKDGRVQTNNNLHRQVVNTAIADNWHPVREGGGSQNQQIEDTCPSWYPMHSDAWAEDRYELSGEIDEDKEKAITSQVGNMRMSDNGLEMLMYLELTYPVARRDGIGHFDENNNWIGVYPHYVFRRNRDTGAWESDGGITFGFGIQVTPSGYHEYDWAREIVHRYIGGEGRDDGFEQLIPREIPANGRSQRVPGARPMLFDDILVVLRHRIQDFERIVNDFASNPFDPSDRSITLNPIPLQQHEFDALVSFSFLHWSGWIVGDWNVARLIRNGPPFDFDFARIAFGIYGGFAQDRTRRANIEWRMFKDGNWRGNEGDYNQ